MLPMPPPFLQPTTLFPLNFTTKILFQLLGASSGQIVVYGGSEAIEEHDTLIKVAEQRGEWPIEQGRNMKWLLRPQIEQLIFTGPRVGPHAALAKAGAGNAT